MDNLIEIQTIKVRIQQYQHQIAVHKADIARINEQTERICAAKQKAAQNLERFEASIVAEHRKAERVYDTSSTRFAKGHAQAMSDILTGSGLGKTRSSFLAIDEKLQQAKRRNADDKIELECAIRDLNQRIALLNSQIHVLMAG